MTRPQPHELLVSERAIRSEFARIDQIRERSYARRRFTTLAVLGLIIIGISYTLWHHRTINPADIPTIKAEGVYKQKPTDPGGIDIPHQDVRVYDELEGKNTPPTQIEHLLPLPEVPKDSPQAIVAVTPLTNPVPLVSLVQVPVSPALSGLPSKDILGVAPAIKQINTTVAASSAPIVVASQPPIPMAAAALEPEATATVTKPETLTIDKILANVKLSTPPATDASTQTSKIVAASGKVAVQLASVPDQARAQTTLNGLQQKYASILGDAQLHLTRVELGDRAVYYRIQSQGLSEDTANQICSSLKQMNAGCILVRK